MATRYGAEVYGWLLTRGWKTYVEKDDDVFVCGDPRVIDPGTGEPLSVYAAAVCHRTKTGEYPDFLPEDAHEK